MSLLVTATNVTEVASGVWLLEMPPHQVRHFGKPSSALGPRSVLLLNACTFDADRHELSFAIDDAAALNVGTTSRAIGIAATNDANAPSAEPIETTVVFGRGDREFLNLVRSELSADMAAAAEQILAMVRAKSPGGLNRGQSRNFSETPDNFWYVIVQPRINELSVTVRGPVEHFQGVTGLEVKDDRGNTRFKVRGEDDVPGALQLIFHAIRKS